MTRRVTIAGLLLVVAALAGGTVAATEEKTPPTPDEASSTVLSLKANMGGHHMEVEVEQTDDGVTVKGTLDEKTIEANGTRQADGTVRVEVTLDKETMLEMTINPEALVQMTTPSGPPTQP